MRETAERHLELRTDWNSQETIDRLEGEAERMYSQGWKYSGAHVDALLENVVLCFERDISLAPVAWSQGGSNP
ncbi:MAG TPA: hypothetical protein VN931_12200 [Fibrobacteria bacterium]|nr:hypothetical protein [Fibrobacteria bacterium]